MVNHKITELRGARQFTNITIFLDECHKKIHTRRVWILDPSAIEIFKVLLERLPGWSYRQLFRK